MTQRGLILEVLLERVSNKFSIGEVLFPEQLRFVQDASPFKTAVCSRRAGKTVACAADLIDTALKFHGVVCLYITLSRNNAKKLIWPELLRLNRIYKLRGRPDNTELSLTFANGSVIYVSGAKDKNEIEKFRGLPIKKAYLDECQSFREYIRDLIDDVLSAALMDYAGSICLIGTPGAVPTGYFHACAHSETWSHHFWTFWENPHIARKSGKTHRELLERELKRRGVTEDDPSIQREFFGRWVADVDSLVFKYNAEKNHFDELPELPQAWNYIIGVDLGSDDADAIGVIAYNANCPRAFLVHEDVCRRQGVTELADKLEVLAVKYKPDKIVMDTGGLGKKIADEINRRWSIPVGIVAAEKIRKFEFIELLNDALRTQKFMAKKDTVFAQDCMLVEWNKDKEKPDKKVVSDRYHSDICDAVLYAYREALHWLSEDVRKEILPGTSEYYNKEEAEMEEAALAMLNHSDDPWSSPEMPSE